MFIMFSPSRRTLKPAPHESPSRHPLKLYPHETSPSTTLNTHCEARGLFGVLFLYFYIITNYHIKSLAIRATAITFSQRYCMKCKENRKEKIMSPMHIFSLSCIFCKEDLLPDRTCEDDVVRNRQKGRMSMDVKDTTYTGTLQISVVSALGMSPISGATVTISYTGDPDSPIETLTTDESGQTPAITLEAPPRELSLSPEITAQPYSEYNIQVTAEGYETVLVSGSEILAGEYSLQPIRMNPLNVTEEEEKVVVIPAHTLFGEYPPKIPEEEIKPMNETGEIVLSRVVIPEYVIVHDGVPEDPTAKNYWVRYKDYIKNVASSEIYSTWPESAIYANILVIQSFTLNRIFTEWYRGRGYDFTITSSTAYDHKWIYGRNIFEEIDYLVDSIFTNYLSRPGVRQPIFTSYCDGNRTTCRGLSQWGSKALADQGYSAIDIIHYYYGNDMYINSADIISGVPSSWPGYDLTIGSSGEKVRQLQQQLNRIARNYPAIPTLVPDGIYGPDTAEAVRMFQKIFHLPQTGIVDYPTWFEISDIYVGVTRISEPDV